MSSNVTIFLKDNDPGRVYSVVTKFAPGAKLTGPQENWVSIIVSNEGATLTLNSMAQSKPGDAASKVLLGAANFFRRVSTEAKSNQRYVNDFVLNTKLLIGVVAEPELSEAHRHFDLLFEIAYSCNGLLFNGDSMIDSSGNLVLDSKGSYDVLVPQA